MAVEVEVEVVVEGCGCGCGLSVRVKSNQQCTHAVGVLVAQVVLPSRLNAHEFSIA